MRLDDIDALFVDTQTTGATPSAGRILELAWGRGIDGPVEEAIVCGPADEIIPSRILKLTGFEPADLALAVPEEQVFARLRADVEALPKPPLAVAHFARFEIPFLDDLWRRNAEASGHPLTMICTHAISRLICPDLPSRSIRAVAGYYGLGVDAAKRAASHVHATRHIWRSLCKELAKHGVTTGDELTQWLEDGKTRKDAYRARPVRCFQVERDIRLALPEVPGVYRMLGSGERILYVGKATSLRARVNTYFRPSQKHAYDKLEMLTQVQKIEVTACETALEAALLETDLIKLHTPPYNVALKTGGRRLSHLDQQLRPVLVENGYDYGCGYRYGPFAGEDPLAALRVLELTLALPAAAPELIPTLFFRDVEPSVAAEGFARFSADWPTSVVPTVRAMLAQGVRQVRLRVTAADAASEEEAECGDGSNGEAILRDTVNDVTPEDVASRLVGLIHHAARRWLRARALTQLSSSTIVWRMPGERRYRYLVLGCGAVIATGFAVDDVNFPSAPPKAQCRWTIQTYDRVRVLWSELARIRREGGFVKVITG